MSDHRGTGDLPPDLPPEHAEAYRAGYERARRQALGLPDEEPDEPPTREHAPLFADEVGGAHRAEPAAPVLIEEQLADGDPEPEPAGRPGWLVPALLAGAVLVLLVAAYVVGRVVASGLGDAPSAGTTPQTVDLGGSSASADPSRTPSKAAEPAYRGRTTAADIGGAEATCETEPGVDSAGHKVRYEPDNVHDGDLSTAWRCDGSGVGERLTLDLPAKTKVGEVGMVPGYAKTDPRSGVDRYAENNRITRVRWTFDDGTSVVQKLDPAPGRRSLQTMRVPLTSTSRIVAEVLGSQGGDRRTIAVSEVRVGAATG